MMPGTVLLMNASSIGIRLRFIGFGKTSSTNDRSRLVAGLVAGECVNRCFQILIGQQREEGDAHCRIRAGEREAGVFDVADANTRLDVRR